MGRLNAFYIPLFIFFIWVVGITWSMLKHIARLEHPAQANTDSALVRG